MRISYITDAPIPSLSANCVHVLHMTAAMRAMGNDVELISPSHPGTLPGIRTTAHLRDRFALPASVTLTTLPNPFSDRRGAGIYLHLAALYAASQKPTLVYTRNPRIAYTAAMLGIKVVYECHGVDRGIRADRAARRLAQHRNLVAVVYISDRLRILNGSLQVPSDKEIVEHDAVDWDRFRVARSQAEARQQLAFARDRFLVVHAGHLYQGRGAELILKVARTLPSALFVFVGGRRDDVQSARRSAAGLSNVVLVGHQSLDRVPWFLSAADVLIMPYSRDAVTVDGRTRTIEYASPMKMFEYMAAGRAIVASRFPGISEVLRNGENALLVEPDSSDELIRAIELLKDEPLARSLGDRARQDVRHYTWEGRSRRILEAIAPRLKAG